MSSFRLYFTTKAVLASFTVSFFKLSPHLYWFPPSKSCVGDQIDLLYASKLGGGSQLILHSMEKTRSCTSDYILWNKRRWQWISWKLRGPKRLCASEPEGGKQSMSRGKWGESRGEEGRGGGGERGVAGRPMLGRPAHFYGQNGGAGEDMVTSPSAFCCIKIKFSDRF